MTLKWFSMSTMSRWMLIIIEEEKLEVLMLKLKSHKKIINIGKRLF